MKKSSRAKAPQLETREQFNACVGRAADLDTMIRYIIARREKAILRLKAAFGLKIEPLDTKLKAELKMAESYAEQHRKELLPSKKKSGETATAIFGFADGKRSVKTLSGFEDDQVIELLEKLRLDYVRVAKEVARDRILTDCTDDETLPRVVLDPAGQPVLENGEPKLEAVKLSEAGLKIHQPESFYVKAKTETAEALKTEAAA